MKISDMNDVIQFSKNSGKAAVLVGPPGVGKTEGIKSAGEKMSLPVVIEALSTLDPIDLRGILVDRNGEVDWVLPAKIKKNLIDRPGIFFLDELSQCSPAVLTVALQILAERRIGGVDLHQETIVLGAMNPVEEGGTFDLPSLIVNRVALFNVNPDLDAYLKYETSRGVGEKGAVVLGFLKRNPGLLYTPPKTEGRAFPTPRSWSGVIRALDNEAPLLEEGIIGMIGEGAASSFFTFRRNLDLPTLEDVLGGKWEPTSDRVDVAFVVASMLESEGKKKGGKNRPKVWEAVRRMANATGMADVAMTVTQSLVRAGVDAPDDLYQKAAAMIMEV